MQHVILPGPIKWQWGEGPREYALYNINLIDYSGGGDMQFQNEVRNESGWWNFSQDYESLSAQWLRP
jgi:hypothetical protein